MSVRKRNAPKIDGSIERAPVARKDFEEALKGVLAAPRTSARSENREPTREELDRRWKLERCSRR